jgi:GNAT superfamily N-acetyltransferase
MTANDEERVFDLVMRGFDASVRPDLGPEGVEAFSHAARGFVFDHPDNHFILLAEDGEDLLGMIDVRDCDHVSLFFVEPARQRAGIGRALLEVAIERCRLAGPGPESVTVHSSLSAVPAYERLGFERTGAACEENGIKYVPMRRDL